GPLACLAFSANGRLLATGSRDGLLRLWDAGTGELRATLQEAEVHGIASVAFTSDGQTLATAGLTGTVKLWDVVTGEQQATLQQAGGGPGPLLASIAFTGGGKRLLAVSPGPCVKWWAVAPPPPRRPPGHSTPGGFVAVSADGRLAATTSLDRTVRVWDATTGE